MHNEVAVVANLEFKVVLDGTRDIREIIEDFVLEFDQPTGAAVTITKNEFVVISTDEEENF